MYGNTVKLSYITNSHEEQKKIHIVEKYVKYN